MNDNLFINVILLNFYYHVIIEMTLIHNMNKWMNECVEEVEEEEEEE